MTDNEPRVGDKINVLTHTSREGRVHEMSDLSVVIEASDGVKYDYDRDPERHTFKILERAEGPSTDLAGTVRSNGCASYVKVCRDRWHIVLDMEPIDRSGASSNWYRDSAFDSAPVVGFVPGSPAAKAAEAAAVETAKPQEFGASDTEPDRSLTLTDSSGIVLKYGRYSTGGFDNPLNWWAVKHPVWTFPTYADWSWWAAKHGPWTVLDESEVTGETSEPDLGAQYRDAEGRVWRVLWFSSRGAVWTHDQCLVGGVGPWQYVTHWYPGSFPWTPIPAAATADTKAA